MIRVALVEDDRSTREGFVKLLRRVPDVVCLGVYGSAEEAEREMPGLLPDVVLMGVDLPGRSGIECVRRLKGQFPAVEFLMLTGCAEEAAILGAFRAGASGYLLKNRAVEELPGAILEASRGGAPMSMEIARRVVLQFRRAAGKVAEAEAEREGLSGREVGILELLTRGLPYKLIADELGISINTVHTHLGRIYAKLHVRSRTEAVVKFLRRE